MADKKGQQGLEEPEPSALTFEPIMLQSLRIRNLALLEEVALDFEAGFTAVTGETGAGKSILLGALALLAGERADKTIIRQGAPACDAEASLFFTDSTAIDHVLGELDLPPCEDGLLIIKRSLPRERAPKITVNGSLASLSALQRLGEHWVDFHGPSEPRRLLKESCQLELLDLFGRSREALLSYRKKYDAWKAHLAERERIAHEMLTANAQLTFDLSRDEPLRFKLLRLSPKDHLWVRIVHHVACDGWSLDLLLKEIATLHNAFLSGEPSPLLEPRITYAEYSIRQSKRDEQQVQSQLDYWKSRLEDANHALDLPTDRPRPAVQSQRGAQHHFQVSPELGEALKNLAVQHGSTLFMAMLAVFSVWLHRHSRQTDFNIGTAIANRNTRDVRNLIGFLVNTLALRCDLAGDPTFEEMMARSKTEMLGAFNNSDVSFDRLIQELGLPRDTSRSPLFQAFLVAVPFVNYYKLTGIEHEVPLVAKDATMYDLLLEMTTREHDNSSELIFKLEYNTDLFDAETASRMAARLVRLMESVVENPRLPISQLPFLPEEEAAQVRQWSEGEQVDFPTKRVEELVAAQVERTPDATAIEDEAGNTLSYRELNARAGILASRLRASGAGVGERVAVCLERSLNLPVAVLAILQSGAAYVPLDVSYPPARLRATLEDAAPCALVTSQALALRLEDLFDGAQTIPVLFVDDALSEGSHVPTPMAEGDAKKSSEDLAYLLYTSGSTGKPKGVTMPHRALANLLQWQNQQSSDNGNDAPRTLQFSPLGFDVSFQEIFSTLSSGGCLLMISDNTRRDPSALLNALISKKVERLFLPFVALQHLAIAAVRQNRFPTSLREVATAGETLLITSDIRMFFENLSGCVLHNHYGPTEAHVVTSLTLDGNAETWPERPTIGRPIANARLQVLDDNGASSPIGVPGELIIEGTPVALGYWNQPELTAEKFNSQSFRTGDIARWNNDGVLELLGRRDAQIKIRGYRVELGEVEAALNGHSEIREAVVIAESAGEAERQLTSGETRLIACVVAETDGLGVAELRNYLRRHVPDYMVPSDFVFVPTLPLTPSGKLDRRAITARRTRPIEPEYTEPQSDLERMLARIWGEVLNVPRVGRTDNFFNMGGQSLLGTVAISRLRDEMQIEVPLHYLFESPTVEQFAAQLEAAANRSDEMDFDDFDEGRL